MQLVLLMNSCYVASYLSVSNVVVYYSLECAVLNEVLNEIPNQIQLKNVQFISLYCIFPSRCMFQTDL